MSLLTALAQVMCHFCREMEDEKRDDDDLGVFLVSKALQPLTLRSTMLLIQDCKKNQDKKCFDVSVFVFLQSPPSNVLH